MGACTKAGFQKEVCVCVEGGGGEFKLQLSVTGIDKPTYQEQVRLHQVVQTCSLYKTRSNRLPRSTAVEDKAPPRNS